MSKLKKLAIFACICSLFCNAACADNIASGDGNGAEKVNPLDYYMGTTYEGTHIFNVAESQIDFIKDGKTDYKIVMPQMPSEFELTAIDELLYFFEIATDISLELVSDIEVAYTADSKYISVGDTEYAKAAGVTADYDVLKTGGFRIVTKGQSVILLGASGRGTLYAVYEFLTQNFNYEFYADNAICIDKDVKNLKLKNFDITDVPDYEYALTTYGFIRHKAVSTNRYRMVTDSSLMIPVGRNMYHNSFDWLPKETWEEEHPNWYSTDGTQLCYTARGDEAEYNAMMEAATEKAKALLSDTNYLNYSILTLTQQDGSGWCDCKTCVDTTNMYNGSKAAAVIHFMNELRENIDEWFEGEGKEYARDLKLLFFGYHQTNQPPTVWDKTEKVYKPVDSTVVCAPGVGVYFAEANGDYTQSFYEKNNLYIAENMMGYGALAKDIFFWSYQVNFSYYLTPYNSFDGMQAIYQYGKKCNATLLFDQGQYNEPGRPTAWCTLKAYLASKLAWDVNADFDQLIDNFFEGYFGPAANEMKKMFDSFRVRSVYNETYNGYGGLKSIMTDVLQVKYWPEALMRDGLQYTDNALGALEELKASDPDKYAAYSANIRLERLSPLYIMIQLYNSKITDAQTMQYKRMFYEDAQEMGITKTGEKTFIRDMYTLWGV